MEKIELRNSISRWPKCKKILKFSPRMSLWNFPASLIRVRGPASIELIAEQSVSVEQFLEQLDVHFSKRNLDRIELRTRLQSKSQYWFWYRKSVVTGTLCKRVLNQAARNENNIKLNKSIAKTFQRSFSNEAMDYGVQMEEKALRMFTQQFCKNHINGKITNMGLILSKSLPFVGASLDGYATCDCCNPSVIEIKSPFRIRETGLAAASVLEYLDENSKLRTSHSYYHQINLYMGIAQCESTFFIIYAKDDIMVQKINFDPTFFQEQLSKIKMYYLTHYLPSILGRKL